MSNEKSRRFVSASLVFGAVIFGMVLAGGLDWTPAGYSSSLTDRAGTAVEVDPSAATAGFADLAEAVSPAVVTIRTVTFEDGRERQVVGRIHWSFSLVREIARTPLGKRSPKSFDRRPEVVDS